MAETAGRPAISVPLPVLGSALARPAAPLPTLAIPQRLALVAAVGDEPAEVAAADGKPVDAKRGEVDKMARRLVVVRLAQRVAAGIAARGDKHRVATQRCAWGQQPRQPRTVPARHALQRLPHLLPI